MFEAHGRERRWIRYGGASTTGYGLFLDSDAPANHVDGGKSIVAGRILPSSVRVPHEHVPPTPISPPISEPGRLSHSARLPAPPVVYPTTSPSQATSSAPSPLPKCPVRVAISVPAARAPPRFALLVRILPAHPERKPQRSVINGLLMKAQSDYLVLGVDRGSAWVSLKNRPTAPPAATQAKPMVPTGLVTHPSSVAAAHSAPFSLPTTTPPSISAASNSKAPHVDSHAQASLTLASSPVSAPLVPGSAVSGAAEVQPASRFAALARTLSGFPEEKPLRSAVCGVVKTKQSDYLKRAGFSYFFEYVQAAALAGVVEWGKSDGRACFAQKARRQHPLISTTHQQLRRSMFHPLNLFRLDLSTILGFS